MILASFVEEVSLIRTDEQHYVTETLDIGILSTENNMSRMQGTKSQFKFLGIGLTEVHKNNNGCDG